MPDDTDVVLTDEQLRPFREASRVYREACADYRAMRIDDTQYLEARRIHDASIRAFDALRGECPPAVSDE